MIKFLSIACNCNKEGAVNSACDDNGICQCKNGQWTGEKCETHSK